MNYPEFDPNIKLLFTNCSFGVSVMGIIPYRGVYFGMYDSLKEKNPYKKDLGIVGVASKFAVAQVRYFLFVHLLYDVYVYHVQSK